jgi:hypothetical protein
VIRGPPSRRGSPAGRRVGPKDSIEQVTVWMVITCWNGFARPKNRIPGLKKEQSEFYTANFANSCPLIASLNRFPRRKNSPYTADTGFLVASRNTTGNPAEISAPVTTSPLFWPNQRRKPISSLPNWQLNCDFLCRAVAGENSEENAFDPVIEEPNGSLPGQAEPSFPLRGLE